MLFAAFVFGTLVFSITVGSSLVESIDQQGKMGLIQHQSSD